MTTETAPGWTPGHRPLTVDEQEQIKALRAKGDEYGGMLQALPASRQKALAITNVQQSMMWAIAAITGNYA